MEFESVDAGSKRMYGPSDSLRHSVVVVSMDLDELPDFLVEQRIISTLELIGQEIASDVERQEDVGESQEAAYDLLGAIDAWASVISTAVARTYAPTSPWRRKVAGWAKNVAERLRWLVKMLLGPLQAVRVALGATSCGIGVAFPWGVSVDLSWE
jgi:hypothetical protein